MTQPELLALVGTATAVVLAIIAGVRQVAIAIRDVKHELTQKVEENTTLTQAVHSQTNGRLKAAEDRAAELTQRLQVTTTRAEMLNDALRFVKSHPEGAKVLDEYAERRRVRVHDADFDRLIG